MLDREEIRGIAAELIEGHATGVEWLSVGEYLADLPFASMLTEAELELMQTDVHDAIRDAKVTVTWPTM